MLTHVRLRTIDLPYFLEFLNRFPNACGYVEHLVLLDRPHLFSSNWNSDFKNATQYFKSFDSIGDYGKVC